MAEKAWRVLTILEVFAVFAGVSSCVFLQMYSTQPSSYMDEIFHVPQAQDYCNGVFYDWDNKITTPPGLYVLSIVIIQPLVSLFGIPMKLACSVFGLRSVNLVFTLGNFVIIHQLLKKLHNKDEGRVLIGALTLSCLPVLYFFTFLYYTDVPSTFFVLLGYLLSIHGNIHTSAMIGCIAVTLRQTNIIWVMFTAGLKVFDLLLQQIRIDKKGKISVDNTSVHYLSVVLETFCKQPVKNSVILIKNIASHLWSYLLVGLGFVVFIIINGGIVLGDKSAHTACFHFPQLFYFAAFSCFFSLPHILSPNVCLSFIKLIYNRFIIVILLGISSCFLVWNFTYYHPYLLADNRHYPFYLNSKILQRNTLIKLAVIPGYFFAIYSMSCTVRSKSIFWKLLFLLCVISTTIPQKLIEFRYFIIPYLIWAVNKPIGSYAQIFIEFIISLFVNALTIYLFINKPFIWENSPEMQRFIW